MIKKFRKFLDEGIDYAAQLTNYSKTLHCLPHDVIRAKLLAYGFHEIDIAGYADNNIQNTLRNNPYIMNKLEASSEKLFK